MTTNPKAETTQRDPTDVMMEHVKPLKMPKDAQDMQELPGDEEAVQHGELGQQQSLERGEAIEAGPVRDQEHEQTRVPSDSSADEINSDTLANPLVKNPDLYGGHRQGGYGNDRVENMDINDEGKGQESPQGDRVVNGVNLDAPSDEGGFADDLKNPKAPKKLSGNES